ncbi:hypothetical protein AIGOOFII_3507 [Methylobacterium marchantiae]|nr:hypothetical protein AIGOOFII_3507 [Methylobacterium marchantiae]
MSEIITTVQENPWTCLFITWLLAIVLHAFGYAFRSVVR